MGNFLEYLNGVNKLLRFVSCIVHHLYLTALVKLKIPALKESNRLVERIRQ